MRLHSPDWDTDLDEPRPEKVGEAIHALDHRSLNPYLVLTLGNGRFIQTIKKSPRRFIVEYREGCDGPHWSAGRVGLREVQQAFLSYLSGNTRYKTDLNWHEITGCIDKTCKDRRIAAAWHVHVCARAVIALNRGTAAILQDAELLDWLTPAERRRLYSLADGLDAGAMKISQFADKLAAEEDDVTESAIIHPKKKRRNPQ